MTRERLERHQAWIYLVFIGAGLATGLTLPSATSSWEFWLWPVLGVLLYATFTQVPLAHLPETARDGRFLLALLLGNFLLLPALAGLLSLLAGNDPAIRLGILLVLLVPCTDWFISFTHQGGGDVRRAITAAPVLLVAQLLLLPFYLWLFLGIQVIEPVLGRPLLTAFAGLILLPLSLAWWTGRVAERSPRGQRMVRGLGWLPVPLLALVVFLVAGSQATVVMEMEDTFWRVLAVFVLYLMAAAGTGRWLGRAFRLRAPAARTLTFSFATRNSFVVLPLALALPDAWRGAVVVIVFQSLVELFGMIAYLGGMRRWIPDDRKE